jgi:hypothetical protein
MRLRMKIYTDLKVRVRGVVRGRTWDQTDMGSLLGSTWPSVGFLLGTNGHGIPSRIAMTFRMIPAGNKRTWDWMDMGSLLGSTWPSVGFLLGTNGHGIPSRIAMTFRMIPAGNKRTWDWMDMGSLLGSPWPSVWFLLGTNGHGIGRTWDPFWDRTYLPYPLISEAWLGGLALSHV